MAQDTNPAATDSRDSKHRGTVFYRKKTSTSVAGDLMCTTIPQNFEAQAQQTPDNLALKFGERSVTYKVLNARSNQLAHKLLKMGVQPGTPVALYLERSIEMVTAILAVLKAGCAYVPIDLAYPRERMTFMLEDTAAPVLLTQSSLKADLPTTETEVLFLDEFEQQFGDFPETNPSSGVTPDDPAYIIYTSGSTGKPKGVIVTHWNVVRLLRSTEHWFKFNSSDVWPLFHSYSFDMSVWELWGALFYGGKLVVVPHAVTRSPQDFYHLLSREGVTFLNQTPSAFRQLIWADLEAEAPLPLQLRHVTCGGEALELQCLRPWFDRHGDQQPIVVNMYGITETTVHTTYRPITQADLDARLGSVIGVPIPDLNVYLVGEDLRPVMPGVPGEICVGGAGVARGYLNRPELNSQRFISDPFVGGNAIMYRSGDLAQINPSGEMEYLGRMDHQVKIRGFRIELGEIESALNSHGGVRESVVTARGEEADKRLVAYYVPVKGALSTSELRKSLEPVLPAYMVPSTFVALPGFPLTNNGKIDRKALPEPGASRPSLSAEFRAPKTEAEQKLAEVWKEVLGLDTVGVDDNYFELGGDSIQAIALLSKARGQGVHFTLDTLFQRPTIAALANSVTPASKPDPTTRVEAFSQISAEDRQKLPNDSEDAYPVAALQLGMFYHNELDSLSAIYHDVFSFEVGTQFNPEKLLAAVTGLTNRHPVLRTSFHLAGFSRPLQVVHTRAEVPFSYEDLRSRPPNGQTSAILDFIEAEKRRPFDRTNAPLMRFHAQQLSSEKFQLFVSFHHCCTDGWSLAALVTEVLQDYTTSLQGANSSLSSPQIGYGDFVALERQAVRSAEAASFWREHLADSPPQMLPRWPKQMLSGGREQERGPEVEINSETFAGLRRVAQEAGVPIKTILLAAHTRVMSVLFGHKDVVTGLVTNGRPEETDGDRLIGLFLNMTPVRQRIGTGTWIDHVKGAFAAEQQVMRHRRFPLAEIQKLHGHPVLETAFDFVHFHVYNKLRTIPGLEFSEGPYFEANNLATYTTFMLNAASTRLELHIDYDPTQITSEQAHQITDYYVRTLEAIANNPYADISAFSPLSHAEMHKILTEWNTTEEAYSEDACIDMLFQRRAKSHPDRQAVEFEGVSLSYRQLDDMAEHLASILAQSGVQPEQPIGLCVERSPRMLVGLLGILKAGCAYVPLDPGFPKERLEFIMQDAGIGVVVTEDKVLGAVPGSESKIINFDSLAPIPAPPEGRRSRTARDLAYLIYTSGSTGRPKGVRIEHRSVVNLLLSATRKVDVKTDDKLLAVTTLSFDIAGLELFMPLLAGARVTIASREVTTNAPALARLVETVSIMQATPSTWRMLIEAGWRGSATLRAICGGEALPGTLAKELLPRCRELWNFYGPTETTIWSTAWRVDDTDPVSIGRPLANTEVYILDADMRPVPVGTTGELWIGGDGLARGYWARPELTAEKFIPHPFHRGERLYRTGDLARYLPDGRIECLGRLDHQVKIRGHRIELGEIETSLRGHKTIRDAVVAAHEDRFGEKRLTAYVVPRNGGIPLKELRGFLGSRLPPYMVPTHFVSIKALPLTPNGKLDLKKLPKPEEAAESANNYVAPEGDNETWLAGIWQEVLEVPRVGAEDNFFDLGADSLSATRAYARISAGSDTQITLKEIFEHPTVRSLAGIVRRGTAVTSGIKRQPRQTSDQAVFLQ